MIQVLGEMMEQQEEQRTSQSKRRPSRPKRKRKRKAKTRQSFKWNTGNLSGPCNESWPNHDWSSFFFFFSFCNKYIFVTSLYVNWFSLSCFSLYFHRWKLQFFNILHTVKMAYIWVAYTCSTVNAIWGSPTPHHINIKNRKPTFFHGLVCIWICIVASWTLLILMNYTSDNSPLNLSCQCLFDALQEISI